MFVIRVIMSELQRDVILSLLAPVWLTDLELVIEAVSRTASQTSTMDALMQSKVLRHCSSVVHP